MPTVTILKPFSFNYPHNPEVTRTPETLFFRPDKDPRTGAWVPTSVEIPDAMAAHPWIARDFADNAIESPARAKARLAAASEAAEKARAEADKATREANAAFQRAQGLSLVTEQREAAVADDINTPVNKIGEKAGIDIDSPELQAALNTPVNVLQAQQEANSKKAETLSLKKGK